MPSPGGQTSGMGQPRELLRQDWVGRVGHPLDLPEGLPHARPGTEPDGTRGGSVEGCPRPGVWSGSARPTGCPTTPSVQDLWSAGHRKGGTISGAPGG
jgi:hypothetical protein